MSTAKRSSGQTLGPDDLVWDHFSRPPDDDVVGRIEAAAAAGYKALGLYIGLWAKLRTDRTALAAIDEALERTGIAISNIDVVRGWASPDQASSSCLDQEGLAYEMADRFGCRTLQAIGDYTGTVSEAARGFAALCDRAAEHDLSVAMEWVPAMTNIETAAQAAAIVLEADRPNGGFCVDSWHLARSTNNVDDLLALPGERVFSVQLNDGPLTGSHDGSGAGYRDDCLSNRVPPGDGEFALVEMVRALDHIGSTAPIGLEVCSAELWAGPAAEAAQVSATAMRRVLAEARSDQKPLAE